MTMHSRQLAVAVFKNERAVQPVKTALRPWEDIVRLHRHRMIRPAKSGLMLGAYALSGKRNDANVAYRSMIQLDIDSSGTKDKTGHLVTVTRAAPPLEDVRSAIDPFEWFACSTHGHDPARGSIKYRITVLPDRDIQADEHEPVLEALDERLRRALDRAAWAWSQAFYLPSSPPGNAAEAFFTLNSGAPLPVDQFVQRGLEIMQARQSALRQNQGNSGARTGRSLPETAPNIELVKEMLGVIPASIDRCTWRNVVWAVAATGWNCARELAREWSITAPDSWNVDSFDRVWSSFDPKRENGIGFGTLEHTALAQGWAGPAPDSAEHFDGKGADVRNGQYFAAMWRHKLVHIHETGTWLQFHVGSGWVVADPLQEDRAAKEVLAQLQKAAADRLAADGPEAVQKQIRHIQYSSRAPRLRAMIDMAKSETGMTVRLCEFDADPMLLGVANGVLDLKSGALLSVSPNVLVSKRCSVAYDPNATCPRFLQFVQEVQPEPDIRRFLQRWAGYCLTGIVAEQVFAFFFGSGANGKSVFIELMASILGDYAHKVPTEMLMHHQRNPQGPSPDIVGLKGLRLAYANETEEGRRLADARVKELTGGDTLTGRIPYGKADIAFRPSHKLVVAGNHKPEISDMSNGMWRRVLLVGFSTTIPEGKQERDLLERLQLEGSGVLNWALEGLRQWKEEGLSVPQAIKRSTAEYREEQDIIGEWISDRCHTGARYSTRKADLYADYSYWAKSNGHAPLAQGRLTKRLNERGFRLQPDKRTVIGLGLSLSVALASNL